MWDSGLIGEKLGFELSRGDENVLALKSYMNTYFYKLRSFREIQPFHSTQTELRHKFEARFINNRNMCGPTSHLNTSN